MRKRIVMLAALLFCVLHARVAAPCGAVAGDGAFVRLAAEKTLIVWDPETKTEHFVRLPLFEGDPKDFGFFVPTPVVPAVAKVDAAMFDELDRLVPNPEKGDALGGAPRAAAAAAAPVVVEQTVRLDDFELVTLRATDTHALIGWLRAHEFASRPSLELWARRYVVRGWVLNAMRYAPQGPVKPRQVQTPAVRLSFAIETPFYPYTEAPPVTADEDAYVARTRRPLAPRPLDLWVVAPTEVEARMGGELAGVAGAPGPARVGTGSVASAPLATLLQPASWNFRPETRATWTITRFREDTVRRTAFDDLTFVEPGASGDGGDDRGGAARYVPFVVLLGAIALALVLALTDRSRPER